MSYLDTFYYPYYSARANPSPYYLDVQHRMAALEHQRYQHNLLERQIQDDKIRRLELDNYARRVLVEDQLQRSRGERILLSQAEAQLDILRRHEVQSNYLDRINDLRRERDLLECNGSALYNGNHVPYVKHLEQQHISDEQLINGYDNGVRGQKYTEELKAVVKPKSNVDQIIEQQKAVHDRNIKNKKSQSQSTPFKGGIVVNKNTDEIVKNSYIDTLKTSKNFDPLSKNMFLRSPIKGQTIDVMGKSYQKSPQKYAAYQGKTTSKKKSKNVKVVNKSVRKMSNKVSNSMHIPMDGLANEAMKKIKNRLEVSKIVYRDSKLRGKRHQIDHLFNTFDCELKIRKEIKDKINNNPGILKKYDLVVDSR